MCILLFFRISFCIRGQSIQSCYLLSAVVCIVWCCPGVKIEVCLSLSCLVTPTVKKSWCLHPLWCSTSSRHGESLWVTDLLSGKLRIDIQIAIVVHSPLFPWAIRDDSSIVVWIPVYYLGPLKMAVRSPLSYLEPSEMTQAMLSAFRSLKIYLHWAQKPVKHCCLNCAALARANMQGAASKRASIFKLEPSMVRGGNSCGPDHLTRTPTTLLQEALDDVDKAVRQSEVVCHSLSAAFGLVSETQADEVDLSMVHPELVDILDDASAQVTPTRPMVRPGKAGSFQPLDFLSDHAILLEKSFLYRDKEMLIVSESLWAQGLPHYLINA